jgi:hypothetical protein
MARWGLLLKLHGTSLEEKKSNFNTPVCFLRLLLRGLYGPSHILTVLETGLKIQRFKWKQDTTISNLLAKLPRHLVVCEKLAGSEGVDASPSKTCLRLPIGETFSRDANGTRGA